jgi:hypothetical protein
MNDPGFYFTISEVEVSEIQVKDEDLNRNLLSHEKMGK